MHRHKGIVADAATARTWTRNLPMAALTAVIIGATISPAAMAQQTGTSRFKAYSRSGPITAHQKPLSLLAKERVKVVVTMSAESVAEARANVAGHVISKQEHEAIHAQIARQHAALEPMIASRGGRVLAHYQDSMNGMKIEIARGEIAGL